MGFRLKLEDLRTGAGKGGRIFCFSISFAPFSGLPILISGMQKGLKAGGI